MSGQIQMDVRHSFSLPHFMGEIGIFLNFSVYDLPNAMYNAHSQASSRDSDIIKLGVRWVGSICIFKMNFEMDSDTAG